MSKLWWIPISLVALLAVIWVGGRSYAKNRVAQLIEEANQEGQRLEIDDWDLSFRLLSAGLSANGVSVDRQIGSNRVQGRVATIHVDNVRVWPLITGKTPKIGALRIKDGGLTVEAVADSVKSTSRDSTGAFRLRLGNVELEGLRIARRASGQGDTTLYLDGVRVGMSNFSFPLDSNLAERTTISIDSIHLPQPAASRDMIARDIEWSSADHHFTMGRFEISPRRLPRAFLSDLQYKQAWLALRIDSLRVPGLDLYRSVRDKQLDVSRLTIGDFRLRAIEDPDLGHPPGTGTKPFPVQILRKLPFHLRVDTLSARRAEITYGVMNTPDGEGEITLSNGNWTLLNVNSRRSEGALVARAEFTFDGAAPLRADFSFPYTRGGRTFSVDASLGTYHLPSINPLMKAAAKAFVESGELKELKYKANFSEEVMEGTVDMRYAELGLEITGSVAWLKNMLKGVAINKHNPRPDGDYYQGSVYHEHDPRKSAINAFLAGMMSGVKSTVVGNLFQGEDLDSRKIKKSKGR